MNSDNQNKYVIQLYPSSMLTIVFFIAKIFDKIDWSWWWIFSPLWIPISIILGILVVIGLIYLGTIIIGGISSWKS